MIRFALLTLACAGCGQTALAGDGGVPDSAGARDLAAARDLTFADLAGEDLAAGPDLAQSTVDLAGADLAASIPGSLDGIWLIGWIGNVNHYSWARFKTTNFGFGTVDILDPMGNGGWTPYFCQGSGSWGITQALDTIQIQACGSMYILQWKDFYPPGANPQGAILASHVADLSNGNPMTLDGWKFPDQQCDANFTMCTLPNGL